MSKKTKISNAPVYYALAQVQFNPVAAMAKYVGEIQDQLRHEGYTLFEPREATHLQLNQGSEQEPLEPKVVPMTSWLITKEDRTAGFILTISSLTFHTTHYNTREEFIPELLRGLKIVHKVVKLEHMSRLGLRYLNAILPQPGETIDQYLTAGLQGIALSAKQDYSLNESVFHTESRPLYQTGRLVTRVLRVKSLLGYPPGLLPHALISLPTFEMKEPTDHAVIDLDHFAQGILSLDFDKIKEQLFALHGTIKEAFKATITDYAERTWFSKRK